MTPTKGKVKIHLRRARPGDALRIAYLAGQLGYPSTPAEIRERLGRIKPGSDHAVFVAEQDRTVIAWLHVSRQPLLEVNLRAEVNGLVVDDQLRSQGTGALLLAEAEKWARRTGCRGMSVRSNVIRERAHRFYERHGYEHYKTQKSFRKAL